MPALEAGAFLEMGVFIILSSVVLFTVQTSAFKASIRALTKLKSFRAIGSFLLHRRINNNDIDSGVENHYHCCYHTP